MKELIVNNNKIHFPLFAPDATYGVIKELSMEEVKSIPIEMILGNTYHSLLRMDIDFIEKVGGLKKYMGWDGPLLTDSGGFQVYSIAFKGNGKALYNGVKFRSPINGDEHLITPQKSIEIQKQLGADIMMCFDECIPSQEPKKRQELAVERTIRWAKICKDEKPDNALLFGIVQGGVDLELREYCAKELINIGFDGYAIGGWMVDNKEQMWDAFEHTLKILPKDKPIYMMGMGTPDDIKRLKPMGVDLFDCVLPTRNGRHGYLYTSQGIIRINNSAYKYDMTPIDSECSCVACKNYTRSYLHHIYSINEGLAMRLGTIHNLTYFIKITKE